MDRLWRMPHEVFLLLLSLATLVSCSTLKVNTLPPPPPTAKLRVYVQPLTGDGKWGTSHEVYVQNQVRRVERFLQRTGIYDVVGEQDVQAVLGGQRIERWQLEPNGWALARNIGEALHADYVIVMERVKQRGAVGGADFLFVNVMINVGTGKVFESRTQIVGMTRGDQEEQRELIRKTYRDIFQSGKQDMLATAIRKGRAGPTTPPSEPSAVKPLPPDVPAAKQEGLSSLHGTGLVAEPKGEAGAKKLIVYDFDVTEQYRTVALILAEALREEVFKMKQYVLVNREDLQKVLEEMALQQTGLIDEKDAVRTGKGFAASQVVTGRLGQLGKVFVMQAKRVDVETFGTLGLASIKFTEGQEEEVLNRLPGFAKELVGLR